MGHARTPSRGEGEVALRLRVEWKRDSEGPSREELLPPGALLLALRKGVVSKAHPESACFPRAIW